MEVNLRPEMFERDTCVALYGDDMEATFTIVDEEFAGANTLARVNCVLISIKDAASRKTLIGSAVIGLGDGMVGVKTDVAALRGKLLTKDNMEQCVVELYE
jgi:hypothetical protein